MFSVFLLLTVAVSATLAEKDECHKLFHPKHMKCCMQRPPIKDDIEDIKECMEKRKPPPNCDAEICAAKIRGVTTAEDGTFDKKALEAEINKNFESMPEVAESIIKNCVNGDLSDFGPPDFCELTKFRHCLQMLFIMNCPDWDTSGSCAESKELIEKCKKN